MLQRSAKYENGTKWNGMPHFEEPSSPAEEAFQ